jgi:hypothetical protein
METRLLLIRTTPAIVEISRISRNNRVLFSSWSALSSSQRLLGAWDVLSEKSPPGLHNFYSACSRTNSGSSLGIQASSHAVPAGICTLLGSLSPWTRLIDFREYFSVNFFLVINFRIVKFDLVNFWDLQVLWFDLVGFGHSETCKYL